MPVEQRAGHLLFSPDELVEQIKQICTESMEDYAFSPVFLTSPAPADTCG